MDKLKYENQWEADIYSNGKTKLQISDLKEVQIKGKNYKVSSKHVRVPYDDMGHTYTGDSTHYFVEEEVFGIKKKFDLNEIVKKVPVYIVAAKYEKS